MGAGAAATAAAAAADSAGVPTTTTTSGSGGTTSGSGGGGGGGGGGAPPDRGASPPSTTPAISDDVPRGPAPGFVIVSKPDKRFGFVATSLAIKSGTYFKFDHVLGTADPWVGVDADADASTNNKNKAIRSKNDKNKQTLLPTGFERVKNLVLKKGDRVIYSVVRDTRTGKLRAANICKTADAPLEETIFSSAPRVIHDAATSNEERKKYLRERRRMLAERKAGKGGASLAFRAQKSGNRRNQFGEEQDSNMVTSGGLLDIVGRDLDDLVPATKKEHGHAGNGENDGKKGGGGASAGGAVGGSGRGGGVGVGCSIAVGYG